MKDQPHLHKGLPYEVDEEKQEHGHSIPSDKEFMETIKADPAAEASRKRLKKLRDDKFKKWKRKRTSLEASLLAAVAEDDDDDKSGD